MIEKRNLNPVASLELSFQNAIMDSKSLIRRLEFDREIFKKSEKFSYFKDND